MLYRQKKDTYIRNYDGIGYIRSTGLFTDRVVNESGTVFLTALSRKAQSLDELIEKVLPAFTGADKETLLKDGKDKNEIEQMIKTVIDSGSFETFGLNALKAIAQFVYKKFENK
ncbi:MAG: hypothetical protein IAA16_00050 [Candidatus Treponema excrementipullorum]|uniref:Uncharacterized protein n=1 Tax=Candidatus Treponema excrementipullorum TaxID=2838768 RepID=A0A9E2L189_9SPIR|nr:hypothetical protein [Candidatus Treponema excrementipullorum]